VQLHQSPSIKVVELQQFLLYSSASFSHGVRHPVDHIHHSKGKGEHSSGIDVDGVCINGLANTLGTALLLFLALLSRPGSSPPRLRLLRATLSRDLTAGVLRSALAVRNNHALIHTGDRQGKQNHCLFAVLYNGLWGDGEKLVSIYQTKV